MSSVSKKVSTKQVQQTQPVVQAPPKKEEKHQEEDDDEEEEEESGRKQRREVTKDTVDHDFSALEKLLDEEIAKRRESKDKGIRFLRSLNKQIKVLHRDSSRMLKLKKRNTKKTNTDAGFLRKVYLKPQLAKFVGLKEGVPYRRAEITRLISAYIKEHELWYPDVFDEKTKTLKQNHRNINADEALSTLLGYDKNNVGIDEKTGEPAILNYWRLQQFLARLYEKVPDEETPAVAPVVATPAAAPKKVAAAAKAEPVKAAEPAKTLAKPKVSAKAKKDAEL